MSVASQIERDMLDLINQERTSRGLNALELELRLNDSSEDHSTWMIREDEFSHTGEGGSSAGDRMRDAGFNFTGSWAWGENLAYRSLDNTPGLTDEVEAMHRALMNSPGHRANILNPDYEVVGIGIETGEFENFTAAFVTQNFARTSAALQIDGGSTPSSPTSDVLSVNGEGLAVTRYNSSQDKGTASISGDGESVTLAGNAWKQVLDDFQITDNTVLRFSLNTTGTSEIVAIGFDDNNSQTGSRLFQLDGVQTYGLQNYNTHGSGTSNYEIRVGDHFTGNFDRLVLVADDDVGLGGTATFSDIEIVEQAASPTLAQAITADGFDLTSFGGGQDKGTGSFVDGGTGIRVADNGWKIVKGNFDVDEDTVLRFNFEAEGEAEIHGVGFETNSYPTSNRIFQLHGTQGNFGIQDFNNYTGGEKSYEIPVGEFFTGDFDRLVFMTDDDAGVGGASVFSDIVLA